MSSKISIVMPVYNSERYLRQSLDGIVNQSLRDIEIICVDDGSTDDSYKILQEYADRDKRITVLKHIGKSTGAAEARNMGLKHARGEYLAFLDSDDLFESNMLEEAYERAKETSAQIVMFDGWAFDSEIGIDYSVKWILNRSYLPINDVFSSKDNPGRLYLMNSGAAWNNLYDRKWIIESSVLFCAVHPDDQVFVHLAYSLADTIAILDKKLIHYRKNTSSSQVSKATEHPEAGYAATVELYAELSKRGILETHRASLINLAMVNATVYLGFMKTQESFDRLFYELKNNVLESIEVEKVDERDYLSQELVNAKNWIMSCTPEQYLINRHYHREGDFEFGRILATFFRGSRVVIYGAGDFGKRFYDEAFRIGTFKIVGWADRNASDMGYPIMSPDEILELEYDFIVVAIVNERVYTDVRNWLINNKVPQKKIIWILDNRQDGGKKNE